MSVYIGKSGHIIMTPNSEKSFLSGIIINVLTNTISINESVEKIKEKIKRKFEYTYSKSESIREEEIVYMLKYTDNVELFWSYKDAFDRMVALAIKTSNEWGSGYKLDIKDYSAKFDIFEWEIVEKNIM